MRHVVPLVNRMFKAHELQMLSYRCNISEYQMISSTPQVTAVLIAQELEDKKNELDERGSNISDSSPVVRIKAAIKSIKSELQQMSVRTGVLQHQLLQVMLAKSRERLTADVGSS